MSIPSLLDIHSLLDSVRARVSILFAASALPLLAAALVVARQRSGDFVWDAAVICVAFAIGLALVGTLASHAVVRPLRGLRRAVEHWRFDGTFEADNASLMPAEIADLSHAFADAAKALSEHEARLREAVAQRDLMMQEIHHRVKNNLQIVASLLNLQASRIRLPEARTEFEAARDRVSALATLHGYLYVEGGLRSINMRSFLVELCGQLLDACGEREGGRISLVIDAPELSMSSDQAVPLSLIVTEAVSNAIKYAFPRGRRGHIAVRVVASDETARLRIEDDGVGIPEGAGESESGPRDGLGLQLIRGFARQIGATLTSAQGAGTCYDLIIPLCRERVDAIAEPTA
jgi:two-component sensor histidine kinase